MSIQSKFGLAMIVRNESAIINRCLAQVRDHIGHWTIIDTGSTDGTPYLIREALDGIPGIVYDRPWVDFGHNRSELMQLARGTAEQLILLDADMVVEWNEQSLASIDFDADINEVKVLGDLEYWMPYIVRGDREWKFRGATHEYLDGEFEKRVHRTSNVNFRHIGDGGSKSDKFTRDEVLLKRQIALEPESPRWIFYLAQTRMSLGDGEGAIAAFRRRTEMGGWDEEIFWSLLQIGEILDARGDWPEASIAFIAAWEYRPSRAEPLMALAAGFRARHMYVTARMYAEQGMRLPIPDDKLFLRKWVYEWGLAFEFSVASWWLGDDDVAFPIWEDLLSRNDISATYRGAIESNLALRDSR